MNAVNETQKSSLATTGAVPSEKLVIHDRTEARIFFDKMLKSVQIIVKAVFFIGCGAVAIALERLGDLVRTASAVEISPPSDLSTEEKPQVIKVPIFPIDDYNQLNSGRILESLIGLSAEQLWIVRNYETTHKNRSGVLKAIDQRLAKSD